MTRALLLVATIAAAVLLAMFLLTFARASAQCGCPAPWEPPTVPQPLPPLQPGGGWVFLPAIATKGE